MDPAITAISIRTLRKKTGMVILVGIAARLTISDKAIPPISIPQKIMLLPAKAIANTVIGANTQP